VYLVELRDNRRLRSNERERQLLPGGQLADVRAPERLDCHYLISAWSPAQVTPPIEPTLDEHALLYDVVDALERSAPLNASRIYVPQSASWAAVPLPIRESDLPTTVAAEGTFAKLAEFWGTMGVAQRWKPVVHLTVTLPVVHRAQVAGYMVTTAISDYRLRDGAPGDAELVDLGGRVLDTTAAPVTGAWVRLLTDVSGALLQSTTSDDLGRFRFIRVTPGRYRFRAAAQGVGQEDRTIDVPSNTCEYDLHLA
jgi:hypothetical protein